MSPVFPDELAGLEAGILLVQYAAPIGPFDAAAAPVSTSAGLKFDVDIPVTVDVGQFVKFFVDQIVLFLHRKGVPVARKFFLFGGRCLLLRLFCHLSFLLCRIILLASFDANNKRF